MRTEDDKAIMKQAIKEASKEWLDEQFAAFGKWTAVGVASALFVVLFKVSVRLGLF
mgnify:CR=1 FL=1